MGFFKKLFSCKPCKNKDPKVNHPKKALLMGLNYIGTNAELNGCINDVNNMKELLVDNFDFEEDAITILTDETKDKPDKKTIFKYVEAFVSSAKKGDILFFHYSGHGGQSVDYSGDELDGMDETLVPLDYQKSGFITDDEFKKRLISKLPTGVKLTVILDCCHSGTGIDLRYKYNYNFRDNICDSDTCPKYKDTKCDVVMISGCRDEQTSADAYIESTYQGALSHTFIDTVKHNNTLTYQLLLEELNIRMIIKGYTQRPVITSGKQISLNDKFAVC